MHCVQAQSWPRLLVCRTLNGLGCLKLKLEISCTLKLVGAGVRGLRTLQQMGKLKDTVKKEKEWRHLHCFKQNYPDFPEGTIIHDDDPDFIVQVEKGPIGIEHTELLRQGWTDRGSYLKAQENEWQKALWKAKQLYETRELPPLDVAVFWNEHLRLTSARRKELQTELADIIATHLPRQNESHEIEGTGLPDSPLPEEVHSIRIARFDFLTKNHWNFPQADWVPELSNEEIREVIAKKEEPLPSYRQKCSGVWLLIVVEGLFPSSLYDVADAVREREFQSEFDKLFLLRYFEGEVIGLKRKKERWR